MRLCVCGNSVTRRGGIWHTHHSFGRIVERLAPRVRELHYHAPQATDAAARSCDSPLDTPNIVVHVWPVRRNSLHALRRPDRLLRDYWSMVRRCDALYLRGSGPLLWTAHWMARLRGVPVVHWIIANPSAVLRSERSRYAWWLHTLGLGFASLERAMLRLAVRASRAYVLANGAEVARLFRTRRTIPVVSTSITEADMFVRGDTCTGPDIRLLFVGFIRPEKGIEYLLRSLPLVDADRPVRLAIVGPWDQFPREHQRLNSIVEELALRGRVAWEGYCTFGHELFSQMDRSDLLVLPSLSEGTPRVLVEARARSLPIISTTVGGIPSSVTDGQDGLLVPPRDPAALASAISRIIRDGDLRRRLIGNGRERVKCMTIDRFVDLVLDLLAPRPLGASSARSLSDAEWRQ